MIDKETQESLRNSAPNYISNKQRNGNYSKSNNDQVEVTQYTGEEVENKEKEGNYGGYKKKNHQGNYSNYNNYYGNSNYNNYGSNYKQNYNDGGYYKNNRGNYNGNNTNYLINEEEAFSKIIENKKGQEDELKINKSRSSKTGGEIIARIDIPKGKNSLKELLN